MCSMQIGTLILCFFLYTPILFSDSLVKNLRMINTATPHAINEVEHPYLQAESIESPSGAFHLTLYHKEPNQIVDEEDWFDQHGFDYPEAIALLHSNIPPSTEFGALKFLRQHGKQYFAVYETVFMLNNAKDIYNEGHRYTLVVFHAEIDSFVAFNLDQLFPDILEMCWFEAVGGLVYFNAAYNGYADIRDNKTGYLYCLDTQKREIIWATNSLTSSYRGFTVYKDHIVTGYGFTAEPDFLYVVDRFSGVTKQTIPIKTAHEHIIMNNEKCYVRTYNMNYVYTMEE